ncbi:unnamed protein product [Amoebophrya sp. A25]|nr:unnamed protein product [Amoebophrya sp. A25]|eukprot:GSA25T00000933001.1
MTSNKNRRTTPKTNRRIPQLPPPEEVPISGSGLSSSSMIAGAADEEGCCIHKPSSSSTSSSSSTTTTLTSSSSSTSSTSACGNTTTTAVDHDEDLNRAGGSRSCSTKKTTTSCSHYNRSSSEKIESDMRKLQMQKPMQKPAGDVSASSTSRDFHQVVLTADAKQPVEDVSAVGKRSRRCRHFFSSETPETRQREAPCSGVETTRNTGTDVSLLRSSSTRTPLQNNLSDTSMSREAGTLMVRNESSSNGDSSHHKQKKARKRKNARKSKTVDGGEMMFLDFTSPGDPGPGPHSGTRPTSAYEYRTPGPRLSIHHGADDHSPNTNSTQNINFEEFQGSATLVPRNTKTSDTRLVWRNAGRHQNMGKRWLIIYATLTLFLIGGVAILHYLFFRRDASSSQKQGVIEFVGNEISGEIETSYFPSRSTASSSGCSSSTSSSSSTCSETNITKTSTRTSSSPSRGGSSSGTTTRREASASAPSTRSRIFRGDGTSSDSEDHDDDETESGVCVTTDVFLGKSSMLQVEGDKLGTSRLRGRGGQVRNDAKPKPPDSDLIQRQIATDSLLYGPQAPLQVVVDVVQQLRSGAPPAPIEGSAPPVSDEQSVLDDLKEEEESTVEGLTAEKKRQLEEDAQAEKQQRLKAEEEERARQKAEEERRQKDEQSRLEREEERLRKVRENEAKAKQEREELERQEKAKEDEQLRIDAENRRAEQEQRQQRERAEAAEEDRARQAREEELARNNKAKEAKARAREKMDAPPPPPKLLGKVSVSALREGTVSATQTAASNLQLFEARPKQTRLTAGDLVYYVDREDGPPARQRTFMQGYVPLHDVVFATSTDETEAKIIRFKMNPLQTTTPVRDIHVYPDDSEPRPHKVRFLDSLGNAKKVRKRLSWGKWMAEPWVQEEFVRDETTNAAVPLQKPAPPKQEGPNKNPSGGVSVNFADRGARLGVIPWADIRAEGGRVVDVEKGSFGRSIWNVKKNEYRRKRQEMDLLLPKETTRKSAYGKTQGPGVTVQLFRDPVTKEALENLRNQFEGKNPADATGQIQIEVEAQYVATFSEQKPGTSIKCEKVVLVFGVEKEGVAVYQPSARKGPGSFLVEKLRKNKVQEHSNVAS